MEQSTDGQVAAAGEAATGDDWIALGRALAAEDPEAYAEARAIVAELVTRVRQRSARVRSVFGFPTERARG